MVLEEPSPALLQQREVALQDVHEGERLGGVEASFLAIRKIQSVVGQSRFVAGNGCVEVRECK